MVWCVIDFRYRECKYLIEKEKGVGCDLTHIFHSVPLKIGIKIGVPLKVRNEISLPLKVRNERSVPLKVKIEIVYH